MLVEARRLAVGSEPGGGLPEPAPSRDVGRVLLGRAAGGHDQVLSDLLAVVEDPDPLVRAEVDLDRLTPPTVQDLRVH